MFALRSIHPRCMSALIAMQIILAFSLAATVTHAFPHSSYTGNNILQANQELLVELAKEKDELRQLRDILESSLDRLDNDPVLSEPDFDLKDDSEPSEKDLLRCALLGSSYCQFLLQNINSKRSSFSVMGSKVNHGLSRKGWNPRNDMAKRSRALSVDSALRAVPMSRYSSPDDRKAASLSRLEMLG